MSYYSEKIEGYILQKKIVSAGTTLLIKQLTEDDKRLDIDQMKAILDAYTDCVEHLDNDIDYYKSKLEMEEGET